MQNIVEMLAQASEETSSEPPSDLEDRFEALLNHGNPDMLLRRMGPNTIGHLAAYSAQYLEREISQQQSEMQAQLDALFPMRDVRDFRIVRVADATIGDRGARRAGMLKVWDARAMGQDALKEGMRYMVSAVFAQSPTDDRYLICFLIGKETGAMLQTAQMASETRFTCPHVATRDGK